MNIVSAHLALTMEIIDYTVKLWSDEINTDGKTFDFDSQDVYKEYVERLLAFNFKDKIEGNKEEDTRIEILGYLKSSLKELIQLYEQNSTFFIELDRESLRLKYFREYKSSTLSDIDLTIELYKHTELPQRAEYFKSDFYKKVGFLNYNYHQEIFNISKRLLKDIESDFNDYEAYDEDYLFINNKSIFDLVLIGHTHKVSNGLVFEEICPFEFYKELNFLSATNNLKLRKGQNNLFYYIIFLLYSSIEDERIKEKWMYFILKKFDLSYTTYTKKYKEIKGDNVSSEAKAFYKEINTLLGIKDD